MPRPIVVTLRSGSFTDALQAILECALPHDRSEHAALLRELQQVGPVPLTATIALMHVHTPLVTSARIAVGWHPDGIALAGFSSPPRELAVLFNPATGSAECHLRTLAALARAARAGTLVKSQTPVV